MHALIFELHDDPVHDGLVEALARHAAAVRDSDGLAVDVQGPGPRLALSEDVETQVFAIAREAIVNVQKHARASAVHVQVEAQQGQVVVEVRDNGRGFDPAAGHPGHFGLDSMRSRAAEIGGWIAIRSELGSGTLVRVGVPVAVGGR
jgi:signal transduction histidine kinase